MWNKTTERCVGDTHKNEPSINNLERCIPVKAVGYVWTALHFRLERGVWLCIAVEVAVGGSTIHTMPSELVASSMTSYTARNSSVRRVSKLSRTYCVSVPIPCVPIMTLGPCQASRRR